MQLSLHQFDLISRDYSTNLSKKYNRPFPEDIGEDGRKYLHLKINRLFPLLKIHTLKQIKKSLSAQKWH